MLHEIIRREMRRDRIATGNRVRAERHAGAVALRLHERIARPKLLPAVPGARRRGFKLEQERGAEECARAMKRARSQRDRDTDCDGDKEVRHRTKK